MKKLILFDVDGTITESGDLIKDEIVCTINNLKNIGYEIGIVGGGKIDKILYQLNNKITFDHYFSECGCVYHKINDSLELQQIYCKNIRDHILYDKINILIKVCLEFLASIDYNLTGHFIDLRNGIIYVSLIGLSANQKERQYFMELDSKNNYRKYLLGILNNKLIELECYGSIDVVEGGSVGIAIYPSEFDKIQVLDIFNENDYDEIIYFGDKYYIGGNDYKLLHHARINGYQTDSPIMTNNILIDNFLNISLK